MTKNKLINTILSQQSLYSSQVNRLLEELNELISSFREADHASLPVALVQGHNFCAIRGNPVLVLDKLKAKVIHQVQLEVQNLSRPLDWIDADSMDGIIREIVAEDENFVRVQRHHQGSLKVASRYL